MIFASILDAVRLHAGDRSVLASFGREVEDDRKVGSNRGLSSILADEFAVAIHTRAFRLLNAAIERGRQAESGEPRSTFFRRFSGASRQFVRALLPFPPLLRILGTVIGTGDGHFGASARADRRRGPCIRYFGKPVGPGGQIRNDAPWTYGQHDFISHLSFLKNERRNWLRHACSLSRTLVRRMFDVQADTSPFVVHRPTGQRTHTYRRSARRSSAERRCNYRYRRHCNPSDHSTPFAISRTFGRALVIPGRPVFAFRDSRSIRSSPSEGGLLSRAHLSRHSCRAGLLDDGLVATLERMRGR